MSVPLHEVRGHKSFLVDLSFIKTKLIILIFRITFNFIKLFKMYVEF